MLELMEHITYMYEPFKTIDGQVTYIVYLKDKMWKVLEDDELIFETPHAESTFNFIKGIGVDLEIFHLYLIQNIANEAALHMSRLKDCEDLIGREACEKTYEAWQKFGKEIAKVVKKETTNLKVIK